MDKRGQTTVFIILGLVIFAAVGFMMVFKGEFIQSYLDSSMGKTSISPEVEPINEFVLDCIKSIGNDALYIIGQHGGYFESNELSTINGVAYYVYDNRELVPSLDVIEEELNKYINAELTYCIDSFSNFTSFNVKGGGVNSEVDIKNEKVVINVDYPLEITKGGVKFELNEFNIEIPLRFSLIHEVIKEIVQKEVEDPDYVCLSCNLKLSLENDFYIDSENYGEDTVIYTIVDPNSELGGFHYSSDFQYYNFLFAVKYG